MPPRPKAQQTQQTGKNQGRLDKFLVAAASSRFPDFLYSAGTLAVFFTLANLQAISAQDNTTLYVRYFFYGMSALSALNLLARSLYLTWQRQANKP